MSRAVGDWRHNQCSGRRGDAQPRLPRAGGVRREAGAGGGRRTLGHGHCARGDAGGEGRPAQPPLEREAAHRIPRQPHPEARHRATRRTHGPLQRRHPGGGGRGVPLHGSVGFAMNSRSTPLF